MMAEQRGNSGRSAIFRRLLPAFSVIILIVAVILVVEFATDRQKTVKIGIITTFGGINEAKSRELWLGISKRADEATGKLKAQANYLEPKTAADIAPAIETFADYGCTLIFGIGGEAAAVMRSASGKYGDITFVALDAAGEGNGNFITVGFDREAAAAKAGALAASVTKSEILGFVSAEAALAEDGYYEGFKKGAASVNGEIEIVSQALGDLATADFVGGVANEMIAGRRCDVIFTDGGVCEAAVLAAAKAGGVWVITRDSYDPSIAPAAVLASPVVRFGAAAGLITEDFAAGKLKSSYRFGGDDGMVELVEMRK